MLKTVYTSTGHAEYDASGNYWGTTSQKLMKLQCMDADIDVSLCDIIQVPFLTPDDDMSGIYPFVTEIYLTDQSGERITSSAVDCQVTVHIIYNRDMLHTIDPELAFGGYYPYADFKVRGSWKNSREWTGTFITPGNSAGRMYFCAKGGAAADDNWLECGNDNGRFYFDIEDNEAQSMSLKSESAANAVHLEWTQDESETLAGYNIYRSTAYDSSKPLSEQNFIRINKYPVQDECMFDDTEVAEGNVYFYYFTIVGTDLSESHPSNVVEGTPLDTQPPVIRHTPVTSLRSGQTFTVSAEVLDNTGVKGVFLYYRSLGATEFKEIQMKPLAEQSTIFRVNVSLYQTDDAPIEYYILGTDGTNTSTYATPDKPLLTIIKAKHRYDKGIITVNPTCNTEGEIVYTCEDCGQVIRKVLPAAGHVYDKGFITKNPGCTKSGVILYTCIYCHDTKKETLEPCGHNYESAVIPADCHHQGYTEHYCTICGSSYCDNFTSIANHQESVTIIQPAGCDDDGLALYQCTLCGSSHIETVPAHGHFYTQTKTAPTCCSEGHTQYTCKYCGYSYTDQIAPEKVHRYDNGTVILEPDEDTTGIIRYTCLDCGIIVNIILPETSGKSIVNVSAVSKEKITAGEMITVFTAASGSGKEFRYELLYKPVSSEKWIRYSGDTQTAVMNLALNSPGQYDFLYTGKKRERKRIKKILQDKSNRCKDTCK